MSDVCVGYVQHLCQMCVGYVQHWCQMCVGYLQHWCQMCVGYYNTGVRCVWGMYNTGVGCVWGIYNTCVRLCGVCTTLVSGVCGVCTTLVSDMCGVCTALVSGVCGVYTTLVSDVCGVCTTLLSGMFGVCTTKCYIETLRIVQLPNDAKRELNGETTETAKGSEKVAHRVSSCAASGQQVSVPAASSFAGSNLTKGRFTEIGRRRRGPVHSVLCTRASYNARGVLAQSMRNIYPDLESEFVNRDSNTADVKIYISWGSVKIGNAI